MPDRRPVTERQKRTENGTELTRQTERRKGSADATDTPTGGTHTELRGRRNPHRVVQLEIAFFGFLALAVYCGRELLT